MKPEMTSTPGDVLSRLERLSVWSLPYLFVGVIGVGFLFTFYDIFDINVSFIQTCTQLVHGCTPQTSSTWLGLPVLLNLVGYVVGTLILSPLADRLGRRDMLLVTMIITGIGSIWSAFSPSYDQFIFSRILTGIGVGADLAIVNTYINEVAPRQGRAKYTSLIFIMSSLGAFVGIWLGLLLTTGPTPFPLGLPFAVAGPHYTDGWRTMYLVGGLLAIMGILVRIRLPESPRWLIAQKRTQEASTVVSLMEDMALLRSPLPPINNKVQPPAVGEPPIPYSAIFSNRVYLKRTLLLVSVWFVSYVTVYTYGAGMTSILVSLHYAPPEAGLIAAFGTLGFILCTIVAYYTAERLERKYWLPISAAICVLGGVFVALGGANFIWSVLGSAMIFFGFNLWVPMTYSWSTENYPTRARTTGFALVDGIGHVGGGLGLVIIAPLALHMNVMTAFLMISGFLVIGAIIAQFGIKTRGRQLEEISP